MKEIKKRRKSVIPLFEERIIEELGGLVQLAGMMRRTIGRLGVLVCRSLKPSTLDDATGDAILQGFGNKVVKGIGDEMVAHSADAINDGQDGRAIYTRGNVDGTLAAAAKHLRLNQSLGRFGDLADHLIVLIANSKGPSHHIGHDCILDLPVHASSNGKVRTQAHRLELALLANVEDRVVVHPLDVLPAMTRQRLWPDLETLHAALPASHVRGALPLTAVLLISLAGIAQAEGIHLFVGILARMMTDHDDAAVIDIKDAHVFTRHVGLLHDVTLGLVEVKTREDDAAALLLRDQFWKGLAYGKLHDEVGVVRKGLHFGRHDWSNVMC